VDFTLYSPALAAAKRQQAQSHQAQQRKLRYQAASTSQKIVHRLW